MFRDFAHQADEQYKEVIYPAGSRWERKKQIRATRKGAFSRGIPMVSVEAENGIPTA
jgi:hypothetical protein